MKKGLLLIGILISLLGFRLNAQTVYITNTGEKYHTGTCRYLSQSKIAIELKDALAQGYEACKVCRPTQTVSGSGQKMQSDKEEPAGINASKQNTATQCIATTQKGSRCRRMTKSPNGKCWQHGG